MQDFTYVTLVKNELQNICGRLFSQVTSLFFEKYFSKHYWRADYVSQINQKLHQRHVKKLAH